VASGVWWLFVGTVQAATGLFLLARKTLSVVFAITIAALNAFTQLMATRVSAPLAPSGAPHCGRTAAERMLNGVTKTWRSTPPHRLRGD
jgi:hypothetical protein